ncbi:hypothetical protein [Alicyclobacillus sp.]|uniref:hypothetical protein n=1 Tax=Alicyclobacillus sp. TaxID=61169 RepID=UPI0025BCDD0E|nr:hypothetical protein [Alicyclobacillus sp.]MCL6516534.1 hypothetical protein [Alicyclobacillus sp.]
MHPANRRPAGWLIPALLAVSLAGCGTNAPSHPAPSGGGHAAAVQNGPATDGAEADRHFPANQPFQNRLDALPTTPANVPNAKPADPVLYGALPVVTPDGRQETLHPADRPVVFLAYWCPHCQRTLVLWDQHWSELPVKPVIVATGFQSGTPLADARRIEEDEIRGLHLQHIQFDAYLLDADEGKRVIQAYPQAVYELDDQLLTLTGERTLDVWKQVFSGTVRG